MSCSAIIEVQGQGAIQRVRGQDYGHTLLAALPLLDEHAKHLGVTPPSRFTFTDPEEVGEFVEDLPDEIRTQLQTQRQWSDASEGIESFSRLFGELQRLAAPELEELCHAHQIERAHLLLELECFLHVIAQAYVSRKQFRVSISA
jgi:hypothetical protein